MDFNQYIRKLLKIIEPIVTHLIVLVILTFVSFLGEFSVKMLRSDLKESFSLIETYFFIAAVTLFSIITLIEMLLNFRYTFSEKSNGADTTDNRDGNDGDIDPEKGDDDNGGKSAENSGGDEDVTALETAEPKQLNPEPANDELSKIKQPETKRPEKIKIKGEKRNG